MCFTRQCSGLEAEGGLLFLPSFFFPAVLIAGETDPRFASGQPFFLILPLQGEAQGVFISCPFLSPLPGQAAVYPALGFPLGFPALGSRGDGDVQLTVRAALPLCQVEQGAENELLV